ncbi:MAG: HNH endonuclease signature motif containing protein [Armatimonadota bacterium]|nr:HNH endonuclease signature motif containing protein [Armatimonadota bacterium]
MLLAQRACAACGQPAGEAHHILRRSAGGDDDPANLLPLCRRCHRRYHEGDREVGARIGRAILGRPAALGYLGRRLREDPGHWLARRYLDNPSLPCYPMDDEGDALGGPGAARPARP